MTALIVVLPIIVVAEISLQLHQALCESLLWQVVCPSPNSVLPWSMQLNRDGIMWKKISLFLYSYSSVHRFSVGMMLDGNC
jgi:hypothetical protein